MTTHAVRLPSRFPAGTKFVIESRPARGGEPVYSRYLQLPDGRLFSLPPRTAMRKAQRRAGSWRK